MMNKKNTGFEKKGKGANPSYLRYSSSAAGRIRTCDLPVNSRALQPTKLRRHAKG